MMRIVRDLMYFEVHLDNGEDITKILSNISEYEKKFIAEHNTWYILNSSLSYFLYMVRDDKKLSLMENQ